MTDIEKGIWVVYSLEANNRIQEMLIKAELAFDYYPDIKILHKKLKKDEAEATLRSLEEAKLKTTLMIKMEIILKKR